MNAADLRLLGLRELSAELSAQAQRKVKFMIFQELATAGERGNTVLMAHEKDLRFGFPQNDMLHVKAILDALLGVAFEEHESSYYGGCYYSFESPVLGEFILQDNFESIEDEWIEEAHHDLPLLLNTKNPAIR